MTLVWNINGQNVHGTWEGYLDQTEEALKRGNYENFWEMGLWKKGEKTHKLRLTFVQTDRTFTGEYRIASAGDTTHYARFKIMGGVENNKLIYATSERIYEAKRPRVVFCFNKAKLTYSQRDGYEYLEGTWEGWVTKDQTCAGAVVQVRRKLPPKKEEKKVKLTLGRNTVLRQRIVTREDTINLHVWDANRVDGDSITLLVNGKKVLEHHAITKKEKGLTIPLQRGKNLVVLHAENLGKTPPNTAAIEVIAGKKRKTVILSSDTKKSEAIRIRKK